MDTGQGNFAQICKGVFKDAAIKGLGGVFREGETVVIKGSKFVIKKITCKTMKLMLLKHEL